MLDVRGNQRRCRAGRQTLRLDVEPQLRRTPGPGRTYAPRQSADRGRIGDRRLHRRPIQARLTTMQPLSTLSSIAVPLLRDNIDTDTIIPASYLRSLSTDPG